MLYITNARMVEGPGLFEKGGGAPKKEKSAMDKMRFRAPFETNGYDKI